ncbi:hypothetical protein [Streptomyces sp. SID7909]|uniref:hypothetical protein n=1 Tax=Streptomyces sp. SID7909 TaxID=2706092 RepID=UPI0013BBF875|nr:hypothetical protein [Streptomyces sp. SID7909]NEC09338.1 hypothetical protein [Streptomyces sp. SID7909]
MNYPCLSSRLIGRSYDMAALRSRMTGTADAALLLFGEEGAGNSALLDALAAELGREGTHSADLKHLTACLELSPDGPLTDVFRRIMEVLLLPPPQRLLAP